MKFKNNLKSVSLVALGATLVLVVGACAMANPLTAEDYDIREINVISLNYAAADAIRNTFAELPLALSSHAYAARQIVEI